MSASYPISMLPIPDLLLQSLEHTVFLKAPFKYPAFHWNVAATVYLF